MTLTSFYGSVPCKSMAATMGMTKDAAGATTMEAELWMHLLNSACSDIGSLESTYSMAVFGRQCLVNFIMAHLRYWVTFLYNQSSKLASSVCWAPNSLLNNGNIIGCEVLTDKRKASSWIPEWCWHSCTWRRSCACPRTRTCLQHMLEKSA